MKDFPRVSVLINNFKETKDLEGCINSLLKTDYPNLELLVMDCCTPDFENWIKKFPNIKYIHNDKDIGLAAQRNLAFKHSDQSSDYVCFMDDDVFVTPQWLTIIISYMEKYQDIGQAQPVLYQSSNKTKIDSLGHLMTHVGYPYKIPATEENVNNLKLKKIRDIFYSEGAISVVRRKILSNLSNTLMPFDSEYFIFFEDVDLSWRIWLSGYRVVIISESFCYHDRGISSGLGKLSSKNISLATKNRLITLLKNYDTLSLVKFFPITLLLELTKTFMLLKHNPNHSKATFEALLWTLINLRHILKKRKKNRYQSYKLNESVINKIFVKTNILHLNEELKRHYT